MKKILLLVLLGLTVSVMAQEKITVPCINGPHIAIDSVWISAFPKHGNVKIIVYPLKIDDGLIYSDILSPIGEIKYSNWKSLEQDFPEGIIVFNWDKLKRVNSWKNITTKTSSKLIVLKTECRIKGNDLLIYVGVINE